MVEGGEDTPEEMSFSPQAYFSMEEEQIILDDIFKNDFSGLDAVLVCFYHLHILRLYFVFFFCLPNVAFLCGRTISRIQSMIFFPALRCLLNWKHPGIRRIVRHLMTSSTF